MKIIQPKGTLNELGYKERVENYIDYAEQRFEEYCKTKSFHYKKLLFNDDADFGNSLKVSLIFINLGFLVLYLITLFTPKKPNNVKVNSSWKSKLPTNLN
jgi:hypothetical protein